MHAVSHKATPELARLMSETARRARETGQFADVEDHGSLVACQCSSQPNAWFRIETNEGGSSLSVTWVSADRYLSQSIEAELMWTGDDLDDLIDEERVDQGFDRGPFGPVEHHRNDEKLFTFRSAIPIDLERVDPNRDAADLVKCLCCYEAAFRDLGDMTPDDDE